jgi:hypothetical protein
MSTFVIALLIALGGGTWAFTKIQRTTGGNTQTSVLMGAIAGVILFILAFIIAGFIPG